MQVRTVLQGTGARRRLRRSQFIRPTRTCIAVRVIAGVPVVTDRDARDVNVNNLRAVGCRFQAVGACLYASKSSQGRGRVACRLDIGTAWGPGSLPQRRIVFGVVQLRYLGRRRRDCLV